MLKVFYMDVAKVNRGVAKIGQDVAYVTMVAYICCKYLFLMFYMFFQT
jgi:hypothetical protein